MITAAMLNLVTEAGEGALVLADGVSPDELERSRLTRSEVARQLLLMADTLGNLSAGAQEAMPEIDWAGWRATAQQLRAPRDAGDDALWFALRSLVPATLSWLRLYRRTEPALFAFRP